MSNCRKVAQAIFLRIFWRVSEFLLVSSIISFFFFHFPLMTETHSFTHSLNYSLTHFLTHINSPTSYTHCTTIATAVNWTRFVTGFPVLLTTVHNSINSINSSHNFTHSLTHSLTYSTSDELPMLPPPLSQDPLLHLNLHWIHSRQHSSPSTTQRRNHRRSQADIPRTTLAAHRHRLRLPQQNHRTAIRVAMATPRK